MLATTSHLVNIGLPNKVMFPMVQVAKMILLGDFDVIIGMDILGIGDFTVTHHGGKTTFSFCLPSRREIDFVSELQESQKITPAQSNKIGRNSPCTCQSGKKYKKVLRNRRLLKATPEPKPLTPSLPIPPFQTRYVPRIIDPCHLIHIQAALNASA
jgi:hypothetical protein